MSEDISVEISHPDGVPMSYTKKLIEFIGNRKSKSAAFYLGHWLAALEDEELEQLRALAKQFLDGGNEPLLDDVVSVCIHAMAVETRKPSVKADPSRIYDWIGALYTASSIDSFRRKGLVELGSTLSIKPHKKLTINLTELGRKSSEALSLRLH